MNFINLKRAVTEIKQACDGVKGSQRTPFFFIVGAGISHPSVPLAPDLVKDFSKTAGDYGKTNEPQSKRDVDNYAHWFEQAHPQRIDRQQYLHDLIKDRPISHANLRLAHLLLTKRITNLVVTPNFDDFLTRSLHLFGMQHVVCDHPNTVERVDHERQDTIQIVHVHGTYWFYDCCNLSGEIEGRAQSSSETYTMGFLLDQILYRRSPLVIGYSGWEGDVIMKALEKRLKQGGLPRRIYWFCFRRENADWLPSWLRDHQDVYFVVPEQESASGVLEETSQDGSPESQMSQSSRIEGATFVEAEAVEPTLSAQQVLDALIETFGLEPPALTRDPLCFFAEQLRTSLPKADTANGESDIYFIDSVIERIQRARDREAEENKRIEGTRLMLEPVRDAIRSSKYRDAIRLLSGIPSGDLRRFNDEQLREAMDAARTSALRLSDNTEEELRGYDLVISIGFIFLDQKPDQSSVRKQVAQALVDKGITLGAMARGNEAVTVFEEVVKHFGTDAELREQVARAWHNKGNRLATLNQSEEAIKAYDEVVNLFCDADEPMLLNRVAKALVSKGNRLGALNRSDEAIAVYDEVVKRFGEAVEPAICEKVATALRNKGNRLAALNRNEDAVTVFDDVLKRFGDAREPALRVQVAIALRDKGYRLRELSRSEEAIAVFDEVIRRFGKATEPALRVHAAIAMRDKGSRLGASDRSEEAITVFDDVVKRFGEVPEPALRAQAAMALRDKGSLLSALDRSEEAITVFEDVIRHFGEATEQAVRVQVGNALSAIGIEILRAAKRLLATGDQRSALSNLAKAREKLEAARECKPNGASILGTLGYVAFLSGDEEEARKLLTDAIRLGGEEIRQGELADADIHPLPQDEAFKELVRSIPAPPADHTSQ
ncbi:MAG TPA: tetratricopeptide repeat protein [Blastocatellia bacterium]|nr:tetratricopeptide repeat protein [Blastocatellia bacterium]